MLESRGRLVSDVDIEGGSGESGMCISPSWEVSIRVLYILYDDNCLGFTCTL